MKTKEEHGQRPWRGLGLQNGTCFGNGAVGREISKDEVIQEQSGLPKPGAPGVAGPHLVLEESGKYSSLEPLDGARFFQHLHFGLRETIHFCCVKLHSMK